VAGAVQTCVLEGSDPVSRKTQKARAGTSQKGYPGPKYTARAELSMSSHPARYLQRERGE
jgi:hypothetical protein